MSRGVPTYHGMIAMWGLIFIGSMLRFYCLEKKQINGKQVDIEISDNFCPLS